MMLAPLPIPTRVYRGESIESYSRRHSGRNHCAPSDVDRALREHGILITRRGNTPNGCTPGGHWAHCATPRSQSPTGSSTKK